MNEEPKVKPINVVANIAMLKKKKGKVYRNWRNQLFPCSACTNEKLECETCADKSNWEELS